MILWLPFILGLMFAGTPWCSSAIALVLGMVLSLGLELKTPEILKKNGKYLMQLAIVAMAFSMDPNVVAQSGAKGVLITLMTLLVSMGAGWIFAKVLKVEGTTGILIAAGTGICGGSAIASLSPVIRSKHDEVAVAMATVFCLNAVALFLFPVIGRWFQLSPEQFGWFAAIAIHDTSSVVGAAAEFHPDAVPIAVTAKLTRALWIIPMILIAAAIMKWRQRDASEPKSKIQIPWFIGLFVLATLIHGFLPAMPEVFKGSELFGRSVLKMAIFIIGTQLTRSTIRAVGPKAMALGIVLWVLMSTLTLTWLMT
ncbi:MAG: putative sulfate exporter family transporter [Proteobacteria bacterium]|nr:putative sulfate exporter family transporter [Pseudomonadota bacterium]